ncbi:MAG: hypothetical protein QM757_28595 [Paludibaculum sp.]
MPDQPLWIERVPQILDALRSADCPPFLDRASVQRLFGGLSARQANRLMQRCHGYQVGRSVLVSRESLLALAEGWRKSGAVDREAVRKQKLLSTLAIARVEARSRAIQIPVQTPSSWMQFDDLSPGIRFAPGELRIEFSGSMDLLQKLFELSQAIANDQVRFEALADTPRTS